MPAHRQPKRIPWIGIGISVIGILFCLYASSDGGKLLCMTSGCALNKNFTIAGVSAWNIGAIAFAVHAFCGLILGRKAAFLLASIYLAGDSLFLLLMAFTLPCLPCLVAGLLFALLLMATNQENSPYSRRAKHPLIFWIWGVLFALNLVLLVKEYTEPVPMYGHPAARIKIYFSPSCPACREAVTRYSQDVQNGKAALYPVAENDQDMLTIKTMWLEADKGISPEIALAHALEHPIDTMPFRFGTLILYWRLWANKALTFSLGDGRVPLIIYNGLPILDKQKHQTNEHPVQDIMNINPNAAPLELFNTDLQNCGGENSAEDCSAP